MPSKIKVQQYSTIFQRVAINMVTHSIFFAAQFRRTISFRISFFLFSLFQIMFYNNMGEYLKKNIFRMLHYTWHITPSMERHWLNLFCNILSVAPHCQVEQCAWQILSIFYFIENVFNSYTRELNQITMWNASLPSPIRIGRRTWSNLFDDWVQWRNRKIKNNLFSPKFFGRCCFADSLIWF